MYSLDYAVVIDAVEVLVKRWLCCPPNMHVSVCFCIVCTPPPAVSIHEETKVPDEAVPRRPVKPTQVIAFDHQGRILLCCTKHSQLC